jgi:hypothetical protein
MNSIGILGYPPVIAGSGSGPCPECPECPECPPDPKATAVNMLWGPASFKAGYSTVLDYDLNDADDSLAQVFSIPRAGSITKVGFCCESITGNPPAYNVGLVTIDAAGEPTTTAHGGSAPSTHDFLGAGWVWVTLATPAAVAAGDICAARVWPTVTAPDVSNCAALYSWSVFGCSDLYTPRIMQFASSWSQANGVTLAALEYATGETLGLPCTSVSMTAYDVADTPDEVGAVFTMPMAATCHGARIMMSLIQTNSSFAIKLYDAADNLLGTKIIADEDLVGDPIARQFDVFWDGAPLALGGTYRLTVAATHATATIAPMSALFESAASRINNIMLPEAIRWQQTSRTDAGAWTEDSARLPIFSLWLSSITLPAA